MSNHETDERQKELKIWRLCTLYLNIYTRRLKKINILHQNPYACLNLFLYYIF